MKIFKETLKTEGMTTVILPTDAIVLSVQAQHGSLVLWYLFNDASEPAPRERTFRSYLTGHRMTEYRESRYLGTVQFDKGFYVVHVFEDLP